MTHDAFGAHARDELGITPTLEARPIQAALASAASFILGAATPPDRGGFGPGSEFALRRPGGVTSGAAGSRGTSGANGRRAHNARRVAGHLLVGARDGRHCRRRRIVRHDCLDQDRIKSRRLEPALEASFASKVLLGDRLRLLTDLRLKGGFGYECAVG